MSLPSHHPTPNAHGASARDLASHDDTVLNDYVDSIYPVGPVGSNQQGFNTDARVAIGKNGSDYAQHLLNNLYTGVQGPHR